MASSSRSGRCTLVFVLAVFAAHASAVSAAGSDPIFANGFDFYAAAHCATAPDADADGLIDLDCVIPFAPADPAAVAPAIDPTTATQFPDAYGFIYEGGEPIQRGIGVGALQDFQLAVVRGQVRDASANPLSGALVRVLDHPELGYTYTRPDGWFVLAVNGGGGFIIDYQKPSFLRAQRRVDQVAWLDVTQVEPVMMIALDSTVTSITLGSGSAAQVARGSPVNDVDGTRRPTVLFPAGTTAMMTLPDGGVQALATLDFRATEYTVGPNGPTRMPGSLPAATGYTHAVELSADQALSAGATRVTFNQALAYYVENYLNLPVGTPVPTGYFDFRIGFWRALPNGRIVRVLSVTGGMADLDVNGLGLPANAGEYTAMGISAEERQRVANLYAIGQSLWRSPIRHFTPHDLNLPLGPPSGATGPNPSIPFSDPLADDPCRKSNSVVECENQTLGETIPIAGTALSLNYRSDRVRGRSARFGARLRLSDAPPPAFIKRIEVSWMVAGRKTRDVLSNWPANGEYSIAWDGLDVFGRERNGSSPLTVDVSFVYEGFYWEPQQLPEAWAQASATGATISADREAVEVTLTKRVASHIGNLASRPLGFGGWTLSVQHQVDTQSGTLYLGTGDKRSTHSAMPVTEVFAGARNVSGASVPIADGTHRLVARFTNPNGIAALPDGGIAITDAQRVYRIDPDGLVYTIAGGGALPQADVPAPGISATTYAFGLIHDMAAEPNGDIFVLESTGGANPRVVRIANGLASTASNSIDDPVVAMAVGTDNTLYLGTADQVFALTPPFLDYARTPVLIAGRGEYCDEEGGLCPSSGDGGPALAADVLVADLATGAEGSVYLLDRLHPASFGIENVRRIDASGTIRRVAGPAIENCNFPANCDEYSGDGGLATDAILGAATGFHVLSDGAFEILSDGGLRRVGADGYISTLAGTSEFQICSSQPQLPECISGAPATAYNIAGASRLLLAPNGDRLVIGSEHMVARITPGLVQHATVPFSIPSRSGAAIYDFDARGRHLRTRNSVTNTTMVELAYSGTGLLQSVTDAHGDETTIERLANGTPVAIVAPDGQRTLLTLSPDGYLSRVENPLTEAYTMTYRAGGLLETFQTPEGHTSSIQYDGQGRLQRDTNPELGYWNLSRTELGDGHQIEVRSVMGRTSRHSFELPITGGFVQTGIDAANETTVRTALSDGTTSRVYADATRIESTDRPDPRFGMLAPVRDLQIVLPSNLTWTSSAQRNLSPTNTTQPLASFDETRAVNGRNFRRQYAGLNRTWTFTTPQGRTQTVALDAKGLPVAISVPGLATIDYLYDTRGRLIEIAAGSGAARRAVSLGYDANGFVDLVEDPENRATGLSNDAIGRTETETLPDSRQIGFAYDRNSNVTGITPPGRPAHGFDYNAVDYLSGYVPPPVSGVATPETAYEFNLDRQLERIVRPDGGIIDPAYDAVTGRLSSVVAPHGAYNYTYLPGERLQAIVAPAGVGHGFTWDGPLLKTATLTGPVAGSVSYVYDANFWLDQVSAAGRTIDYGYDNDGLLSSAALIGSPTLSLTHHAQNGLLTGTTLGVVSDSWTYNEFAEPTQYIARENGTPRFETVFVRDKLGRITRKTETLLGATRVTDYTYDTAGRLDTVTVDSVLNADYGYDSNGNRIAYAGATAGSAGACFDGSTAFSASYDAQDRMSAYGACSYQYTANGELTEKRQVMGGATPDEVTTFNYDVFGNLRSATLPDATQIEYVIDGLNRRVGKKVNGTLIQGFLYLNQLEPIAELNGAGAVVATFVYADRAHVPSAMQKGADTYRIVVDHLGSVRLVINSATGAIAQSMDYDEWGNVILDTNPGFQPFGYAGGIYDRHTGLTRFGARDYDPVSGRWAAKEPLVFAGGDTSFYVYANGDPVNFIDSNGLWPWSWEQTVSSNANFWAGFGDEVSFGLTKAARDALDIGSVDKCSSLYNAGGWAGFAATMATGYGAGTKVGARWLSGKVDWQNFSHSFIPQRVLKRIEGSFAKWLNKTGNRMNGDHMPPSWHDVIDPVASRVGAAGARTPISPLESARNILNSIPYIPASALFGAGSAALNDCGCD